MYFVRVLSYSDQPEVESDAYPCEMRGFAKFPSATQPHTVFVELVASRLGALIGLPTVPGMVARTPRGPAFISMKFGLAGERLPPIPAATFCAREPFLAAGVVAFDCWIANPDRNAGNLAWSKTTGLGLFDHDGALLASHEPNPSAHSIGAHCLAQYVNDLSDVDAWLQRIEALPPSAIDVVVRHSASESGADATACGGALSLLTYRRGRLRAMIEDAFRKGVFRMIGQGSLLLGSSR